MNKYGRIIRDVYACIAYPISLFSLKINSPDSHIYKKKRIAFVAKYYKCQTLIETGTFYGQMVNFAINKFEMVKTVELWRPFYLMNKNQFDGTKVEVYSGRSQDRLPEMISTSKGRVLFWLDGHCSGPGTGGADDECPILRELNLIAMHDRNDHCILIDDARLFIGENGYPTIDETFKALRSINSSYKLTVDRDCIMALPANI